MFTYALKVLTTSLLIVSISELSKRSSFLGALLASIPLISVIAMVWLYIDTKDVSKVSSLSTSVFWLVIPSLILFVLLPVLLKSGMNFYISLFVSLGATAGSYFLLFSILRSFGVSL